MTDTDFQEQRENVYASMKNYALLPFLPANLCSQVDSEIFFPGKGMPVEPAKRICQKCPEQEPCRAFAIENGIQFGVWGGTSEKDRRMLRTLLDG